MHPILLNAHSRSLTKIKYNHDGDLLLSASKDNKPNVWYSHNGERLGSFNGHQGSVWDIDISRDSKRLLTASGDSTCRLWDVETGKEIFQWTSKSGVRAVAWAQGDRSALYVTDDTMGQKSHLFVISVDLDPEYLSKEYDLRITFNDSRATVAKWGDLNKSIYTGHADGTISKYDARNGNLLKSVRGHEQAITDFQWSPDMGYFITSSKDHTAKIWDAGTLKLMKEFMTERPVNSAALSPIRPQIILGGGQDAMSVTTTAGKQGKFEVRFFHLVFEEEIGRVKGHFGPINTLAFHPAGTSFASGGEDGYVRIHHFDDDYYKFKYAEENDA